MYIKTFLPLGSESSYRHQLRGYLAGLAYLPGSNENEDVLKCLHQCAESLQIPAVTNVMSSGIEGAFSELSLDSSHGEVSSLADVNRERRSYESMRREIKGMPR